MILQDLRYEQDLKKRGITLSDELNTVSVIGKLLYEYRQLPEPLHPTRWLPPPLLQRKTGAASK
jgi:hypothetical protein